MRLDWELALQTMQIQVAALHALAADLLRAYAELAFAWPGTPHQSQSQRRMPGEMRVAAADQRSPDDLAAELLTRRTAIVRWNIAVGHIPEDKLC